MDRGGSAVPGSRAGAASGADLRADLLVSAGPWPGPRGPLGAVGYAPEPAAATRIYSRGRFSGTLFASGQSAAPRGNRHALLPAPALARVTVPSRSSCSRRPKSRPSGSVGTAAVPDRGTLQQRGELLIAAHGHGPGLHGVADGSLRSGDRVLVLQEPENNLFGVDHHADPSSRLSQHVHGGHHRGVVGRHAAARPSRPRSALHPPGRLPLRAPGQLLMSAPVTRARSPSRVAAPDWGFRLPTVPTVPGKRRQCSAPTCWPTGELLQQAAVRAVVRDVAQSEEATHQARASADQVERSTNSGSTTTAPCGPRDSLTGTRATRSRSWMGQSTWPPAWVSP